jgi:ABC-type Fe3+-siderophore transport system permease subunit
VIKKVLDSETDFVAASFASTLAEVFGVEERGAELVAGLKARVAKATDGIDAPVAVANTIGPADMGVGEVWSAVASHLGGRTSELTPIRDGIVWNLRLPHTLLAAVCGAGLAIVPLGCPGHSRPSRSVLRPRPASASPWPVPD